MSKRKKSLLFILYYYHPYSSGLSIYIKRIAEGLAKKGYDITILTSLHEKDQKKEEVINGVKVIRRPILFKFGKGVFMPTLLFDTVRLSRKFNYINPVLPMAEIGLALLFIPKNKIITSYVCDINLGKGILNKIIMKISYIIMDLALRRSSKIFVLNHDFFNHSKMKHHRHKAVEVLPIIYPEEFSAHDDYKKFFQEQLKINKGTKKIGFVGRIVYEKGINYLLESITYLNNKLDDFKIIIVGDYEKVAGGSVKEQLDEYLEKHPGKIIFTGFVGDEDLRKFYTGIDTLVLPSIDPLDAFGMVQVEAMLCGTPVVASNMPGIRLIVKKTGFGLLSKIKDPEDIAKKITTVITENPKYVPERARVIESFNPQNSLSVYEEILS